MPAPRYVPRNYAPRDAAVFGKQRELRWVSVDNLTNDELDERRAAQIQHSISLQINEQILYRFDSLVDYADFAGAKPATLGRMLRGETVMRLEDIARAERLLGIESGLRGEAYR
jgi:hypothetical protein